MAPFTLKKAPKQVFYRREVVNGVEKRVPVKGGEVNLAPLAEEKEPVKEVGEEKADPEEKVLPDKAEQEEPGGLLLPELSPSLYYHNGKAKKIRPESPCGQLEWPPKNKFPDFEKFVELVGRKRAEAAEPTLPLKQDWIGWWVYKHLPQSVAAGNKFHSQKRTFPLPEDCPQDYYYRSGLWEQYDKKADFDAGWIFVTDDPLKTRFFDSADTELQYTYDRLLKKHERRIKEEKAGKTDSRVAQFTANQGGKKNTWKKNNWSKNDWSNDQQYQREGENQYPDAWGYSSSSKHHSCA